MKVTVFDVKLGEIERIEQAVQALSRVSIPAREAWAIAKLFRFVKAEAEDFRAQRNKVLAELGTSKNGYTYDIPAENIESFNKRIRELAEITVEVPFPSVEFKLFEKAELAAEVIEPLIPFMFPDMEGNEL